MSRPAIDPRTAQAARIFMTRLEGRFAALEGRLFGSRAKGTARADSDADLAVILEGTPTSRYEVAGDMAEIAFDILQETGVLIDPLPLWEGEWSQPLKSSNRRLIAAIKRESVQV